MAQVEPFIIPGLKEYSGGSTLVLAQYLLEEIYRDYHAKHLLFVAASERRLVPTVRWRKEMRDRVNYLCREISGLLRDRLVFVAILSISPAFMEALIYPDDEFWRLLVILLAADKPNIEFYARSRGVPFLQVVRELIPDFAHNPDNLLMAFDDAVVARHPYPNSISDEVLHRNLNDHGPDTFYLSLTGAIIPIQAPSYNDSQPSGLQVIDIEECSYDETLFSRYSRTPGWPWQIWPRHPQLCDHPDTDGVRHPPVCPKCLNPFSGEDEWHDPDLGCQCHHLFNRSRMIQIVEFPPFPNQPDVVNRGVRALEAFDSGTMLGEYTGELVPHTTYDPDSEICDQVYLFGLYDQPNYNYIADISARLRGNWTRFINHTGDKTKQNVDFVHTRIMNRLRVVVMAIKDIEFGDEILGNYGDDYFESREFETI
ncbi:hypothetical protein V494_03272 [Pseudogymnoascus sp. VKM F-4513 (FW-928)]|nr:hypothetical protein V494_03272 [Pseudogymnoascus sp. VKM F-4513 (FW-928)]